MKEDDALLLTQLECSMRCFKLVVPLRREDREDNDRTWAALKVLPTLTRVTLSNENGKQPNLTKTYNVTIKENLVSKKAN